MAGVVNVPLYMNPASQPQRADALAMMRAELLAQNSAQNAQQPADNEMAGNVVVRHSPLEYLSHAISGYQANKQQLKAAQLRMQLMGQAFGGMGQQGGTGPGGVNGINPQQLRTAAIYDQLYGPGSGKAYLESIMPTVNMKDAASSGLANPLAYARASAQNTAQANAGVEPVTYTDANGITHQTTKAALAAMATTPQQQAPMPPVMQQPVAPVSPQPPAAPVQSTAMAPIPGFKPPVSPPVTATGVNPPAGAIPPIAANVPNQNLNAPPGSITASERGIQTPPQDANIVTNGTVGGMPLSGAANTKLANAVDAMHDNGGMIVQSPAQQAGATEAQKNYQGYLQNLNKEVSEFQQQLPIINAQEDFMKLFQPGAGAEQLAQAATIAKSLGASPQTISMISRGDPGAVEAFDSLASQHAMKQAVTLMSQGSTNGGSGGRMSQAIFEKFREDLSNPNKQRNAILAINALTRQQAEMAFKEQQAAYADAAAGGNPLTFQERYAKRQEGDLMKGRDTNPATAIQQGSVQSQMPPTGAVQVGTMGGKPVYKLPDGRGWTPD